ncbi:hypothetical protein [Paenibacillus sp. FSL K6-1230]|uniref:hypothetical protein n=1 Tax=Paenibacillus sp. FSL K6-1230 TaxID=2921603 RepID=UPI0030F8EE7D
MSRSTSKSTEKRNQQSLTGHLMADVKCPPQNRHWKKPLGLTDEILGGVFFMRQQFKTYSMALKMEAIRLHIEEKWTYRGIMEEIHSRVDKDQRLVLFLDQYEF